MGNLVGSSEATREAGLLSGHECQGRAELAQRSCRYQIVEVKAQLALVPHAP